MCYKDFGGGSMKKALALALTFLLACPAFVMPGFAVCATGEPVFEVSSHTVLADSTVDVTVSINNCPGIASAKLVIDYDSDLTLNSVTYGAGFTSGSQVPYALTSPVILNWVSLDSFSGSAVFATLNFTAPGGIATGAKHINVSFDPDDVCDVDENNVGFTVRGGAVTVVNCLHEHTEVRNARPLSMTQTGYTGDIFCLDCGELVSAGEEVFVAGDSNADGVLDIRDLVRLKKFLSDNAVEISVFSDITGDGLIRADDYLLMCGLILET